MNDHICLKEWQNRLKNILNQFYKKVTCWDAYPNSKNNWKSNTLYFLFNVHAQSKIISWPTYFIHIQSEVYPTPYFEKLVMRESLLRAQETWDYSAAHVTNIKADMG